jgi:hypothetical protein
LKKLIAISIRQPLVERILTGEKTEEFRGVPARIRGPVYLYATQRPLPLEEWKKTDGLADDLPLGAVVGTVEITDCRLCSNGDYAYTLANPKRLPRPVLPETEPRPIWFYPFGEDKRAKA